MATAHLLGFPRIGPHRELKQALERYWAGTISKQQLQECGQELRRQNWLLQTRTGIDYIPVGDFAYYDHVLNTSLLFGVVPERFGAANPDDLDTAFRCARGRAPTGVDASACEMTKWFDTNYHYIVPEFSATQPFSLHAQALLDQIREAQSLTQKVKPVLLGPVTFLYLGKTRDGSNRLDLLARLIPLYQQLLEQLQALNIEWVQIDEPILSLDLDAHWQQALRDAYSQLQPGKLKLLLTTYFGALRENFDLVQQLPVHGLHIDAVRAADETDYIVQHWPVERILSIGIVDGRNIWRNDLQSSLKRLEPAHQRFGDNLWITSSCSLLHVPVDLNTEQALDPELKSWLSFAVQKIQEVITLTTAINHGAASVARKLFESDKALSSQRTSTRIHRDDIRRLTETISAAHLKRHSAFKVRKQLQAGRFKLPLFPTTTIGSFPQTAEIRSLRAQWKKSVINETQYHDAIKAQIRDCIHRQEDLGLDVLVHGEAERNDMVEYFAEYLEGFTFTQNGWVQSYGSRCVKPPLIYGDIARKQAITVDWSRYAQSLTSKPLKGMLTGPITLLSWSFARTDISRAQQANQLALALRAEVRDLEQAGISIIQIDEPALREGLPLRRNEQAAYLDWAVSAFRLATSGVADDTQIHTHMCYSEFNEIIGAIADLDADVITIETSRSDMKLLGAFERFAYPNDIGPGVYDIHTPLIPSIEQVEFLLEQASTHIAPERLWVNPDCGLKTRAWPEVSAALTVVVAAAKRLRGKYASV